MATLYKKTMSEEITRENVKKYGWSFLFVDGSNENKPDFSYSIGFEETLGHPEIMIFGLKKEVMHSFLSDLYEMIKDGTTFSLGARIEGIAQDPYHPIFKEVKVEHFNEYLGTAMRYYNKPFRAWVLLWPDKNNILPTDPASSLTVQDEAVNIV